MCIYIYTYIYVYIYMYMSVYKYMYAYLYLKGTMRFQICFFCKCCVAYVSKLYLKCLLGFSFQLMQQLRGKSKNGFQVDSRDSSSMPPWRAWGISECVQCGKKA